MTDTKPTIEEQIEWAEVLIKCDSGIAPAVLASLKRLQAIEAQPVPVEPAYIRHLRALLGGKCADFYDIGSDNLKLILAHIDSLQSALQVAQQELEVQMVGWSDCEEKLTKAEACNKQLVELLKELLGALKHPVPPTQKQWDAIGVVSDNILREMGK
jgi:hypothetical protein